MAANRLLTLDPSNPDDQTLAANWQDGQEYDIALHVRQTAPFRFEIVTATETETPGESGAGDEADTAVPATPPRKVTGNPAVDNMMA